MMKVSYVVSDDVTPALQAVMNALDGDGMELLNETGAREANTAAIDYHQEFNEDGKWRGRNYMSGPGRLSGDFGQNVALGWNFQSANRGGATIANNADYYAFKVTGGTIKPKRAKNLTIPMVPEAAGRRVKDYQSATGNLLFRVLGKKALFEKTDSGGIRAVYALVKEVTQKPWPDALPGDDEISFAFGEGFIGGVLDLYEEL